MIEFSLAAALGSAERVLAIGCHSDDIEIGAGGLLLALTRARPGLHVTWIVLSADGERAAEARASARDFLSAAESADVRLLGHRESFFPYVGVDLKDSFEEMKAVHPDLVLTHTRNDLHQDHRLACELTWNTFRNHLILEYEIPKYDGDLGTPNVFVPLDDEILATKLRLLRTHFASQADRHWFDDELFRGLHRIRGMEAATRYAEAFTCRKLVVTAAAAVPEERG